MESCAWTRPPVPDEGPQQAWQGPRRKRIRELGSTPAFSLPCWRCVWHGGLAWFGALGGGVGLRPFPGILAAWILAVTPQA